MKTADLVTALRRSEAYPVPPAKTVDVVQTHISLLFFVGDRVYKVKKPVALDFLDYSTLEKRRHFCEEEVRLNRRLTRDVYLGVAPIARDASGAIRVNGPGETIEYAVEMVRLPDRHMMSERLDRGEIDNQQIGAIVQTLVRFHREAATGPGVDEFGRSEEIAEQVEANFRELEAFVTDDRLANNLSRLLCDHLHAAARTWMADHADLLDERVRDGRIREGHGDLHAGNICLAGDALVIYDCIEFSRRFRCRDVACELAFLAMDLDLRCFRGFAAHLLQRYGEQTDDPRLPLVAEFYKLHLALVRGKVASLRAVDPAFDTNDRRQSRLEAMRYFHLAGSYALPPAMILTCGLPASGKSHAAREIARPFEAVILRSDVVRKELAGLAPRASGAAKRADIYTAAFTRQTYAALLDRAKIQMEGGRTVIVDATFSTAAQRGPFLAAAHELGIACLLVEMTCREDVIRRRLAARAHDRDEVSDADWSVYLDAKERFEPPDDVPASRRLQLDSDRPPEEIVAPVVDGLVDQCRSSQ